MPSFSIPPDAPQPGGNSQIITDDFRTLNAVWSNGSLWCGQNVTGSNGQSVARWYQIALADLTSPTLTQSGDVTGVGSAYYPALGVEAGGAATMSFTTSSGLVAASAAYTGRQPADAPGTMRGYAIVKQGLGPYDESAGDRWGDYSGISLDPSGTSFWGIAEYAGAPDPQFGTEIVEISGEPSLEITPSEAEFTGVLIGQTSAAQSFTVTNASSNAVALGTASVGGVNGADFGVSTDQCSGATLVAGGTCTVSVTFLPTLQTWEFAYLSLGDQNGTIVAGLAGFGTFEAILNGSPSPVNFPDTVQQMVSAPLTVTMTNNGNLTADISRIVISGPFTQTNNCGTSLAVGASCQFQVTFYPTGAFAFGGTLQVQSNQASTLSVALNGTGITAPAAVPCPAALNFGNQVQGTTSAPQTVTLTNTGSAALAISAVTTSGDFAATNNCPSSLNPRTSCSIGVSFTPTTLGTESGTLSISDNATGGTQVVTLSGAGVSSTAAARLPPGVAAAVAGTVARAKARTAARLVRAERPLDFEPNLGQFRPGLRYVAHVTGYALGVTRTGLELEMSPKAHSGTNSRVNEERGSGPVRLEMRFAGANPNAPASGVEELPGKANYFFGRNPRSWRTNVPTYAKVRTRGVYPGIDLVYYGNQPRLEYDFVVRPRANPGRIRLAFEGASGLRIDRKGDLLVETAAGAVRLHKPAVYQVLLGGRQAGQRVYRRGGWQALTKQTAEFRLGRYDHSRELVIDPVLSFSTYLGGSGGDTANTIAVDAQGNAYVAGETASTDFPVTANAFQKTCGTSQSPCRTMGFVAKLSADGSTLLYATYLGGSQYTQVSALAVDSAGDAYLTGYTNAADFPTTSGAFQTTCNPSDPTAQYCAAPFVTKLDPSGSSLLYSTYLGETGSLTLGSFGPAIQGNGIALDSAGDAYVGGGTTLTNFPTTAGAFEAQDPMPGVEHGFLSELNPAGTALVFSTYLGGTGQDQVNAVTVSGSQAVYATGETVSLDFPTSSGAFQRGLYSGPNVLGPNAFVVKFSLSGSLDYSTLLGGTGQSGGQAIAVDSAGAAYITGDSNYGDFPTTPDGFETTSASGPAYVAKVHPDGCALEYATYLGPQQSGFTTLRPSAIALDASGDMYVAGQLYQSDLSSTVSSSLNLPMVNPLQPTLSYNSGFVGELNATGSALLFSSPFGGSDVTQVNAMALDSQGDIYVTGETRDTDLPVANALESTCSSCTSSAFSNTSFVAKISPTAASGVSLTRSSLTFAPIPAQSSSPLTESVGLMNNQSVALNIQSVAVSGAGYTLPTSANPCGGSIAPGAGCIVTVQFDPTAEGTQTGTVTITDDGPGSPRQIALTGTGLADFSLFVGGPQPNPLFAGTSSATYSVTVLGVGGTTTPTGDVALTCTNVAPATCTFNPATLSSAPGQYSTLTVGNLSAIGDKPLSFGVTGTLDSQTATTNEQIAILDFSLSALTNSATVTAGSNASYSISVAPINGFNDDVSFRCSGLPANSACLFSPTYAAMNGTTTITETLTISTTARSGALPLASPESWPRAPLAPSAWWALACAILLLLTFWSGALRRRKVFLPVLLLLLLASSVSCGGGGGSTASTGTGSSGGSVTGTPAGTYTVTVTGTTADQSQTPSHSTQLSLTVQ